MQKKHRHKHKRDCEEHLKRAAERAAELHDEKLFKQPPQLEDCPICMIRSPCLDSGTAYMSCCGKVICSGCIHAFRSRVTKKEHDVCPFCRTPPPSNGEVMIKRYEKRSDLNDPIGMRNLGSMYARGLYGLPQNMTKALELWHCAGELGDSSAFHNIGIAYNQGRGVEVDGKKATYYFELAAMRGDEEARHNLGLDEFRAGNVDRALRHWMIAVKNGDSASLKNIKLLYSNGYVMKDNYAKALRSYQAYLDEIKSDQRDEAAASNYDRHKYYDSAT